MSTASRTWTVARQVAFFPTTSGGKLHAARKVSRQAACGAMVDLEPAVWVTTSVGESSTSVHPMVCRRCLSATTTPNGDHGVEQ